MRIRERGAGGRSRLPWLGILIPLGLGFVLSLGLAYQTWDAARRHRAAAEATVRDHAAFAAHLLASRVDRRMSQAMLYAFYFVDLSVRNGERWPGVEVLRAEQELGRCQDVTAPADRVFFRWVDDVIDILGPHDAELPGWLRAWAPDAARAPAGARSFGVRFDAPGVGPAGIAYRVFHEGGETAVFGLDNCFRDLEGDVFQASIAEAGVLPPTLVGDTPNDSLFTVTVLNGSDETIWGARSADYAGFGGRVAIQPADAYGGLTLALRLRSATAEQLVIGGLPRSRLPEALGLVALTALLLGIAARQLRRGQELVRLRERFVANVSHELRTPLQQILLFADLLRLGRVSSEEESEQALSVIDRETRRLINLVEDLLSFSRPDAESAPFEPRDTALLALAGTVVESFQPIAGERDVQLELDGDEVLVNADPDHLQRVLLNLLDNAVAHGPDGQTVRIEVSRRGSNGVLSVRDEGPGIPERDRDRIWEANFTLGRDDSPGRMGQGMGLTIVRDLVERMGGRVRLADGREATGVDGETQAGATAVGSRGGARFEVEIPASA